MQIDVGKVASDNTSTAVVNYHCSTRDDLVCQIAVEVYGPSDQLIGKYEVQGGLVFLFHFKHVGKYYFLFRNKDKREKLVTTATECINSGVFNFKTEFIASTEIEANVAKCKKLESMINQLKLAIDHSKEVVLNFTLSNLQ
jgi:hypothetical protein